MSEKSQSVFDGLSELLAEHKSDQQRLQQAELTITKQREQIDNMQAELTASKSARVQAERMSSFRQGEMEQLNQSNQDRIGVLQRQLCEANTRLAVAGATVVTSEATESLDLTPLLIAVHASIAVDAPNVQDKARYLRSRGWKGVAGAANAFRDPQHEQNIHPLALAVQIQSRRDWVPFRSLLLEPPRAAEEIEIDDNAESVVA